MTDPRRLLPGDLVRLLNSTPLGEVLTDRRLRRHRQQAGLRICDGRRIDLVRYVAWLSNRRHAPRTPKPNATPTVDLDQTAAGAAATSRLRRGGKRARKAEAAIAALLTEPTHAAAAAKAGVSQATLYRWLRRPRFRRAYRNARREILDAAVGRLQAASAQAVATLLAIVQHGARDADRLRASVALLDLARSSLRDAELLQPTPPPEPSPLAPSDITLSLAARLRHVEASDLPTAEKAKLVASLAATLLDSIRTDTLDARLEALQTVLASRPKPEPQ